MKIGTLMDPFHRAYRYIPDVGLVNLQEEDVDAQVEEEVPVNDEPEPDDPDLSDHEAV